MIVAGFCQNSTAFKMIFESYGQLFSNRFGAEIVDGGVGETVIFHSKGLLFQADARFLVAAFGWAIYPKFKSRPIRKKAVPLAVLAADWYRTAVPLVLRSCANSDRSDWADSGNQCKRMTKSTAEGNSSKRQLSLAFGSSEL